MGNNYIEFGLGRNPRHDDDKGLPDGIEESYP